MFFSKKLFFSAERRLAGDEGRDLPVALEIEPGLLAGEYGRGAAVIHVGRHEPESAN